jgi:hypothetical protein
VPGILDSFELEICGFDRLAVGATLRFLPPYSPDFNPIKKTFSRFNAMLERLAN